MANTILDNGIVIPEKGINSWYEEIVNNYTLIDTHLGDADKHLNQEEKDKIDTLSNVANTGDYNDLINIPSIPKKVSELINDRNYITSVSWEEIENKPSVYTPDTHTHVMSDITDLDIPTKTSDLDNDCDYTTTSYVDTKVAGLVNSAPETLDTLNELASALGNDPNFATTVANQIGTKANDSDVVHKSGTETITGDKTYSYRYVLKSPTLVFGDSNSGNLAGNHTYRDKNGTILGSVGLSVFNDYGFTRNVLTINNPYYLIDSSSPESYTVGLQVNHTNGSANFFADRNGLVNLGLSTNKWNNVYANTFNGNIKLTGNADLITNTDDSTYTNIVGGTSSSKSPFLQLAGSSWGYEPNRGMFVLAANNGTNKCDLQGKPDGTLSWSGTVIKTNTFEGNLASFYKLANNDLYRNVDNGYLALGGGSKFSSSSLLILGGVDNSSYTGQAIINIKNSSNSYNLTAKCTDTTLSKNGTLYWGGSVIYCSDNSCDLGNSAKRFKDIYATNATINTSDSNAKQDISVIDDKLLDAWGNINPVSFKFISSVEQKGDEARVHTGYIAQDVKEELDKYGIDACKYGLFCYNSWDAQEEQSHEEERTDEEGNTETIKVIDTPAREAGETYGLRYIECLVVECAYLRKKNKELEDRIIKLEENLNA